MELTKKASESAVEMCELVLPNDVNLLNNLKGGSLMHWMDIAAALSASKHSNRVVATVSVDSLDFRHPVKLGEMIRLRAHIVSVGNTSMKIKVTIWAENLRTNNTIITNEANLVFVALDDNGKPTRVPRLEQDLE